MQMVKTDQQDQNVYFDFQSNSCSMIITSSKNIKQFELSSGLFVKELSYLSLYVLVFI